MDDFRGQILYKIDIVSYMERYISLSRRGNYYISKCPFHAEKTPSFHVNPEKKLYYCFGCKEGGDVFSFLMKYKSYSFSQAFTELANELNIPIKGSFSSNDHGEILFEILKWTHLFFQDNLKKNTKAMEYLKNRGLNMETILFFQLGVALKNYKSLMEYLKKKKFL